MRVRLLLILVTIIAPWAAYSLAVAILTGGRPNLEHIFGMLFLNGVSMGVVLFVADAWFLLLIGMGSYILIAVAMLFGIQPLDYRVIPPPAAAWLVALLLFPTPYVRHLYELYRLHRLSRVAARKIAAPTEVSDTLYRLFVQRLPSGVQPPWGHAEQIIRGVIASLYTRLLYQRAPAPPVPAFDLKHPETDATRAYINEFGSRDALWSNLARSRTNFFDATAEALLAFYGQIPVQSRTESPFSIQVQAVIDVTRAAQDIQRPFLNPERKFAPFQSRYYAARTMATQKISPRRAETKEWVTPVEYAKQKGVDAMLRDLVLQEFQPLFDMSLPYAFVDDNGQPLVFRHHFIVGAHGTGKTTYLSALIREALELAENEKAAVFIMDSQNELIPEIVASHYFGEDVFLREKIVYLEPDPAHPLQLNIFDVHKDRISTMSALDRDTVVRGAAQMVNFFLSSIVNAEATGNMDTLLKHLIPAVMTMEEPTIFSLIALMEEGNEKKGTVSGYDKLKGKLKLDKEERRWFETRLYSAEFSMSRAGIRTRLDGFVADSFFREMFRNPVSKLDLFAELQQGKVILVNTNKGYLKDATEPLGRFFLAKLLQATEERMLIDKGARLPVYAFIDEAADYIAEERNIAELFDKARKQLVSLTIAVQGESQITNEVVLAALRRGAIQSRLTETGYASVSLLGRPPVTIAVPNVRFDQLPQTADVEAIKADMWDRYSVAAEDGAEEGSDDSIVVEYEEVDDDGPSTTAT